MGKGKNMVYKNFIIFHQCFQKNSSSLVAKTQNLDSLTWKKIQTSNVCGSNKWFVFEWTENIVGKGENAATSGVTFSLYVSTRFLFQGVKTLDTLVNNYILIKYACISPNKSFNENYSGHH